ncbi:hypothetical protein OIU76_003679 [Salix suchowensis]|uniref:Uncharacterized protein n=1 Tax=Salix suchowensis TaxID=1278906 RepID=A0ABQ9BM43_9ROSI|nr:hypothetical protein OIU76_003679 [Salix suchowensis]KAJ6388228.1 hypothetical protein OIU77_026744 [Salix suchowensis]
MPSLDSFWPGYLLVAAARGGPMKWRLFNIVYKKVPQLEVSLILGYPQGKTKLEKTLNRPWTAWAWPLSRGDGDLSSSFWPCSIISSFVAARSDGPEFGTL